MRLKTTLSEDFLYLWNTNIPKSFKLTPELKFHPNRKWRFDYALEALQLAFEVEGGVWVSGRHNRPKGFICDCEKYNTAALLGWTVFRITEFGNTRAKTNEIVKQLILNVKKDILTFVELKSII